MTHCDPRRATKSNHQIPNTKYQITKCERPPPLVLLDFMGVYDGYFVGFARTLA